MKNKVVRKALLLASHLYGVATRLRNILFDTSVIRSHSAALPVFSIGNITVGGNGKTPFTQFVARNLLQAGVAPVILSRGYPGCLHGPHLASLVDDVREVGDEALLHVEYLYPDVPVVIARDRVAGVQFIAERNLGDCVLLDDGFQHRRLKRDLDFVLIDVTGTGFKQRWREESLLPSGRFREDPRAATARADAIVLVRRSGLDVDPDVEEFLTDELGLTQPVLGVELFASHFVNIANGQHADVRSFNGVSGVALTAIARPGTFSSLLEEYGISLSSTIVFPDHHLITEKDWAKAVSSNSNVFVTEKDAVKIRRLAGDLSNVWALALGVRWQSPTDGQAFWSLVRSRIPLDNVEQKIAAKKFS